MFIHPILRIDSYKSSHHLMYPPDTEYVVSYIESRGGDYDYTVFNGLQGLLLELESNPITTHDVINAARTLILHGVPFNTEGWLKIVTKHNGRLPIKIEAVPEGTVVGTKNVLVKITNTDPEFPWLTSYMETMILRAVWYPTTVATRSHKIKQVIRRYLEKTGDVSGLPFKLHDFGARGVSSSESAQIGGTAHLINFMGTDTVEALVYANAVYGETMAGNSIPASEHSTITLWGKENEARAYANMIEKFGKGFIFANVSDSYDIWNAITNIYGKILKSDIDNMDAIMVVRPDSGNPVLTPVKVVQELDKVFGHTANAKGYKVLNKVRVIQGDGVNEDNIEQILETLENLGYSADNIAFGMGAELIQNMTRDTLKFAMKACAALVHGQWIDVFKSPIDQPDKKSKTGLFTLVKDSDGKAKTVAIVASPGKQILLETVFENGVVNRYQSFADVRNKSNDMSLV